MKTKKIIGNLLASVLMAYTLSTATPAVASSTQDQKTDSTEMVVSNLEKSKISKPTINLESALNSQKSFLPFRRVDVQTDFVNLKYDFNKSGDDVLLTTLKLPKSFALSAYAVGDFSGSNVHYLEAIKSLSIKDADLTFVSGAGFGKNIELEVYGIGIFKNKDWFAELALYESVSNLKNLNESVYVAVGKDFKHSYLGLGKAKDKLVGVTGIKGFKDFGALHVNTYDHKSGDWMFVSQAALGDVNQGFFSKKLFDFVTEYFTIPQFFPVHFTPQVTKGTYSLKLNGKGNKISSELEGKIGWNNKVLPVSAGVNVLRTEAINGMDAKQQAGLVVELYKDVEVSKLKSFFEVKYNTRTNAVTAFVGVRYN